jgi:hypothetical protein
MAMDYGTYKASIIAQGSYCYMGREQWERAQQIARDGQEVVFEVTSKKAELARGWYKNVFGPENVLEHCFGPFDERHDAECA